eukprot:EC821304.1.p1 GENE.EC821304.1~~EC821304.1.p1  ORF type:complete len:182 (+),score=42.81 EC821304.1:57-548(+)
MEYYYHVITKACNGNKHLGVYLLAAWIFCFSFFRDILFSLTVLNNPVNPILDNIYIKIFAIICEVCGWILVSSSLYKLGIFGTYLADYFGILMSEKVTSFPFNVLDNPMYVGSTLNFLGSSLLKQSNIGLILTAEIAILYKISLYFEEPFTNYIYSHKDDKKE